MSVHHMLSLNYMKQTSKMIYVSHADAICLFVSLILNSHKQSDRLLLCFYFLVRLLFTVFFFFELNFWWLKG